LEAGRDSVVGVVTQPDRPKGRRLEMAACPAKAFAAARSIPVFTPEKVNTPESVEILRGLNPDLIVVVAYGQMLRPASLNLAPYGCINVHASLLPRYRGAAPIAWAIARGETKTGVTTMYLNERMDAGDLIDQEEVAIESGDTAGTLQARLAGVGGRLLLKTIASIVAGTAVRTPQDEALVTYAPKLNKTDGRIEWRWSAGEICTRIRAFDPWPGCYCEFPAGSGNFVKIERADPVDLAGDGPPGTVCEGRNDWVIQAGEGGVLCRIVRPPGGKSMEGAAFLRGHPLKEGDRAG